MTQRPNILFIMDDQHRWDYLGCAGASFVSTPNIDKLAAEGVRFTQCTTNAPVCAPARIALACGQQPHRVGAAGNNAYLPQRVPTYYQHLRDHGYVVGGVGKFDLAKPSPFNGKRGDRPFNFTWGFTHPVEIEGKMHAGNSPTPLGPYGEWLKSRGEYDAFHADYKMRAQKGWAVTAHDSVLPAEAFADSYIGARAAQWIDESTSEHPWHLFVSFVGPHDPYDPPTSYANKYRDADMPAPVPCKRDGRPAWVQRKMRDYDAATVTTTRQQYCASIEAIDDAVGRILEALDRTGQRDNTYIVFASDHGEMLGDHGLYTKSVPYEAALRVPLMISGPGIVGNRVSDALVELIDINPTITAMAGLTPQQGLDAKSLMPVLGSATQTHRDSTVSQLENFKLIRTATHKLVRSIGDGIELYDLVNDPDEQHNVAAQQPDMVQQLQQKLNRRMLEGQANH